MTRTVWGALTRAWRLHILVLGLLIGLASFLVALALGAGAVGAAMALRDTTAPLDGQSAYVIVTRLADDADAQDALVRAAIDQQLSLPVIVERSEVDSPGDTPFARWEVRIPTLSSEDAARLIDAGDRIRLELRDTEAVVRGIQVDDALTPRLAPVVETLPGLRNLSLVPAGVLFLIGMVVVVQVAATLPRSRQSALRILDARGASRLRIAGHAAVEMLLAGGLGAGIGVALARLALSPWGSGPLVLQAAAGAAFVFALAVAAAADSVQVSHRAGRPARLPDAALLLVTAILAGVTMWRLLRTGVDVISAPAVGLTALTGAIFALVIVMPIGRALAGLAARARGLTASLSFRLAARRHAAAAPAALLVALAVTSLVLAAGFGGTERATRERDIVLDRGADLRLQLPAAVAGRPATPIARFAQIDGVAAAIGARVATGAIDTVPTTVVIVPAAEARDVIGPEAASLAEAASGSVPAIASRAVVDRLALTVGDRVGVTLDGPTSNVELVGISEEIPAAGGPMAIMVDEARLAEYLRAQGAEPHGASEVWIALDGRREAGAVAQEVLALEPGSALVEIQAERTLAAATVRLSFWAVAGAAVGFALVGLASLRLSESAAQGGEAAVLRSLGVSHRAIRAVYRRELYARAVPAAIGGACVGALLSAYVVPVLVTLASGSTREPVVALDALALAVGLGGLALTILAAAHVGRRP